MGKQSEKERTAGGGGGGGGGEKRFVSGVVLSCVAELKFLTTTILVLCAIATLLLLIIPTRFTFTSSDLRFCIAKITTTTTTTTTTAEIPSTHLQLTAQTPSPSPPTPQSEDSQLLTDKNGVLKRVFRPYGVAAYNFITMGAYRGGANTFSVIGLSSKPLHRFSKPSYKCEWVPHSSSPSSQNFTTDASKFLPDWGYGRVYTVVVVNCTFSNQSAINANNSGGRLILHAASAGGFDTDLHLIDSFEVLTENPGDVNFTLFTSKPKYDYFYCGSPLFGGLSPQRVREWIAYHVRFFGEKSHFVIHDAGGVHEEILEVLKPWMELGYVTLQDVRDQERFDGYYHNQFMVVNDCLHRNKFMAKWMFLFDVDEFIYVPPKNTIKTVLDSFKDFNQFTIEQMPMSSKLCLTGDYGRYYRKWGFEKLVYRDVKKGIWRDRKYAIQPRNVFATGVHMSENLAGKTTHKTEGKIMYFHYHGTIAQRREPCRKLVNASEELTFEKNPYVMDTTMRDLAWSVKKFETKMIGPRSQKTKQ